MLRRGHRSGFRITMLHFVNITKVLAGCLAFASFLTCKKCYFQKVTCGDSFECDFFLGFRSSSNVAEITDGDFVNVKRIKYVNVSLNATSQNTSAV